MTHFTLIHERGTFEGFNFRTNSAIEDPVRGTDVLNWDHDRDGEAEFWPSGDHRGVTLIFAGRNSVHADELQSLDRLLTEVGYDNSEAFALIAHALTRTGKNLLELTSEDVTDAGAHVFRGGNFMDVRREAAFELFETYFPELYRLWESAHCDGLRFDPDDFLDSPAWSVDEYRIGDEVVLIVSPG